MFILKILFFEGFLIFSHMGVALFSNVMVKVFLTKPERLIAHFESEIEGLRLCCH